MSREELQVELERLRAIFQNVNDAIFLCDVNSDKILDANDRALQLLGYSREELLQTPVSAVALQLVAHPSLIRAQSRTRSTDG